jgi:hypothetical protein
MDRGRVRSRQKGICVCGLVNIWTGQGMEVWTGAYEDWRIS